MEEKGMARDTRVSKCKGREGRGTERACMRACVRAWVGGCVGACALSFSSTYICSIFSP